MHMILKQFLNKRSLYILLTLLWVAVIFFFSLQPADTSNQISTGLGRKLVELFMPNLSEEGWELLHHLIRKAGHFTEFFILGVLTVLTTFQIRISRKKMLGLAFCVVIASLDETLQLFVAGRSGQVSDIVIDSVGALIGVMLFVSLKKFCDNRNKRMDF